MKRTLVSLAAVLAATTATAASAQTYTFTAKSDAPTTLITNKAPDGRTYVAMAFSGKSEATAADGKKSSATYKCVLMSQPPNNAIFMSHATCESTAPDGTFVSTYGCNNISADEIACVGGTNGTGCVYAGRRGTTTTHGKGGLTTGTGQWNN